MAYVFLAFAIGIEVASTSLLKATDGFTRPLPTACCLFGYALSFYLLSRVVEDISIGIAYALWSGLGTLAIVAIGATVYGQSLSLAAVGGIALVVVGVVVLNLSGVR